MFEKLEGSGHEESFDEEKARYQEIIRELSGKVNSL